MPKTTYIAKNFSASHLEIIETADQICTDYAADGYTLTLRQLYYQFVARDHLPNTQQSYKRLGSIINDARLAGLIDWQHLEDRTRNLRSLAHWSDPSVAMRAIANQYAFDRWEDQPERIEVWIEKDALAGVIEGICRQLDVPYFSCRGYVSQSEMWSAAQRLIGYESAGQVTRILHLGDHDPSGIDMSRDIADRLRLFGSDVLVERIALNMDQIEQYDPPPNPAKLGDARAKDYMATFGDESWELDALEPQVLRDLIAADVELCRDDELWFAATERQEAEREALTAISRRWDDVAQFLGTAS